VHGDAALEQIFSPGTLLRVVIHGARVVGGIERPIFDRHVELEVVVATHSGFGAILGFAVGNPSSVPRPHDQQDIILAYLGLAPVKSKTTCQVSPSWIAPGHVLGCPRVGVTPWMNF